MSKAAGIAIAVLVWGGCQLGDTAAPDALLVVATPPSASSFVLGYHDGWVAAWLETSADGNVFASPVDCDWLSQLLPQPPEAMLAREDSVVVFCDGQVWRVVGTGQQLEAKVIGNCPSLVRQVAVLPAGEAGAAVLVALLAGGYHENGQLRAGELFLGTVGLDGCEWWPTQYPPEHNPWLIRGGRWDERRILFVGAVMPVHFDPQPHRRPQIFEVLGGDQPRLRPIWLGSSLSRPFVDVIFVDIDGDGEDELAAVELTRSGDLLIQVYRWRGSGFEGVAASGERFLQPPWLMAAPVLAGAPGEALMAEVSGTVGVYRAGDLSSYEQTDLKPVSRVPLPEKAVAWAIVPGGEGEFAPIVCLQATGEVSVQQFPTHGQRTRKRATTSPADRAQ